jgi:carbon-monoxide dehydrogenase medium subunit
MIPQPFAYTAAQDLSEALRLVQQGAKPLAGGMSLIPMMKLRLAAPEHLVDLRRVAGLNSIRQEGNQVRIGALATHHEIESSALLLRLCPLLPQTASHIGDMQVRNMGTIGGSIAHADPAADYPAALQALEADIKVASSQRERTIAAAEFFLDPFTTALEEGEIVVEVSVPVDEPQVGTAYRKMVHPASGFAVVGVAVRVRKEGGRISWARVGVTGLSGKSFRALAVEQALTGTAGSEQDVKRAAALVAEGVEANQDLFASAEYRKQLARTYTARALRAAIEHAQ